MFKIYPRMIKFQRYFKINAIDMGLARVQEILVKVKILWVSSIKMQVSRLDDNCGRSFRKS